MPEASTPTILYGILMLLGILGNILVFITVISNAVENKTMPPSDLILANISFINFLITVFRNTVVFTFQLGFNLLFSTGWCRVFMFIWTVLRSMSVWGTFSVSVFHYISISKRLKLRENTLWNTIKALFLLWTFNCLYFIPAFLYSERVEANVTFSIQLVSSTTRPLMGCIWRFPSPESSLLYVTASLVIHELIPIFLMVSTNMSTLYTLNQHSKAIAAQKTMNRVASERRAALVITVLVVLFVTCWGTNVLAVNFYNFTKGSSSTEFLITLANFVASFFMGFSPLILLGGHSKLRRKLRILLCKQWKIRIKPTGEIAPSSGVTIVNY